MDAYDFNATSLSGEPVDLARYRGQVALIVNVASRCGFTPQYAELQMLYERFRPRGFVVLAFPCNQFAAQEPGTAESIRDFCDARFGVSFPMFAKVDVNGPGAHPLFEHLKRAAPGVLGTRRVKWNFTKFLVDREGRCVSRHAPTTRPSQLEREIERLLEGAAG